MRYQSQEEADAQDRELTAESRGWSEEQASTSRLSAEAVGAVAGEVGRRFPSAFVGSQVADDPEDAPTLYIRGPVAPEIEKIVASAPVAINIVDNQPYSFAELDERTSQAASALLDAGYSNVAVGSDITRGLIVAEVQEKAGLSSDPDEIAELLPEAIRREATIQVKREPVASSNEASEG